MKNLILVLTLVLASPSWAGLSCASFLKEQHSTTPLARVSFDTNGGKRHTLTLTRDDTALDASFTKKFLTGLTSFFAGKSTTTSRLEERAVMATVDSAKLLEESGLKWEARDKKKEGEDFTTITTYSDKFIMDSEGEVDVSAKMRARKYYTHNKGEINSANMKSVFGDIGSIELKVANVAGVTDTSYQKFESSVFKPKIFISDDGLKRLSKMSLSKLKKEETRKALVEELYAIKYDGDTMNSDYAITNHGKLMNPNRAQIEEFINALILLLEQNPNLFDVQIVVAYNRDSYSAKLDNGTEYQYTLDRNIRIYEPSRDISSSNLQGYLDGNPLHKVEDDVAFAELKSPLIEKAENTPAYQRLSFALFSRHRASYAAGKGKYSLGNKARETMEQTTLSEQLHTEGLEYYLIKGIGNMYTAPNRKHLVEHGVWNVALPFQFEGKEHKLVLGYKQNKNNGVTQEILSSITFVNSFGEKVSVGQGFISDIIEQARRSDKHSTININDQALTFPGVIDAETVTKVTDFFDRFYTDHSKGQANPRDIDSLHMVNNSAQLAAYNKRMNWQNRLSLWKDRLVKQSINLVLLTGAFYVANIIDFSSISDSVSTFLSQTGGETVNLQIIDGSEILQLQGNLGELGNFNISPVEPVGPVNPDLTIDLNTDETPNH